MKLLKLTHFTQGPPTLVTRARGPQVGVGAPFLTAAEVESRGDFVGNRFVLDEAIFDAPARIASS